MCYRGFAISEKNVAAKDIGGGEAMVTPVERRHFLKSTATGVFAFTVGGVEVLLSASEVRAQGAPFRLLKAEEAQTIEALGETLVPGARAAGIAHFVDQQLSVPPEEALLRGAHP